MNITTGSNVNFTFNSIRDVQNGVIIPNATQITIESTVEWDLYVGSQTSSAGFWDVLSTYSVSGSSMVPVGILDLRFTSPGGTSQLNSFTPLTDNSSPNYVIGSAADDPASGAGIGTNIAGDILTNPASHQFRVDYKLTPGLTYTSGAYGLTIVYTLTEDL